MQRKKGSAERGVILKPSANAIVWLYDRDFLFACSIVNARPFRLTLDTP
jgi:hypothetical protein